jgi:serine/threonine protein kinase
MKFNKRLRRLLRPLWEEQYINYKRLKQELKRCLMLADGVRVHTFLLALDDELGKVNAFFETQRSMLADQLDATVRSLHAGCLSDGESAHAQRLFVSLQAELAALRSYAELNYVAVLKIVKKANKVLQPTPVVQAHALLLRQPFYTDTDLSRLLTRVDIVAAQLAVHDARVPPAAPDPTAYTCSICLDLLSSPVVLPCSHRFCASCIAQHLDAALARDASTASSSRSASRATDAGDKPMLNTHEMYDLMRHQPAPAASCPICRRAVNPLSVQVDTILERFIVRSFGQSSLDAEKQLDEQPLVPPLAPALVRAVVTEHPTRVGAYSLGDLLGRGRYAHVYIGQRSLSSVPHAVKVFKGVREANAQTLSGIAEAAPGDKVAEAALTVQQQTVFRLAAEAETTAVTEVAVLRAVAPYSCAHLPELVDVVYMKTSRNVAASRHAAPHAAAQQGGATDMDADESHDSDDEQSSDVEDEDVAALDETNGRCWAIVLPLYGGGDLAGFVDASRGVPEHVARLLMRQLIAALATMHAAGYIHRDVKADNVLIRSLDAPLMPPGTPHLVLCDMGLAVRIATPNLSPAGTLEYIPPEALCRTYVAAPPFDVWSLGILLFAMVAHRFPFNSVESIRAGNYSMSRRFSAPLSRLMEKILCADPARRITIMQIASDPWFRAS